MSESYEFIGAELSLYSGKVRAYLRYKDIPYTETLSTLEVYKNTIVPRVGKRIIPVLITPEDECIQDSTLIIDHLESRFPQHAIYPDSPTQRLIALLLETYGDEWLVMPAMHYRWHYKRHNLVFIVKEFGSTVKPHAWSPLQYAFGAVPAMLFGNLYKPYFGIKGRMKNAIETSYTGLLSELNTHFEQFPYLLGERPCIGDYGLIGPFYAHLYRDPYSGRHMKQHAPWVAKWVERMEHLNDARYGDFVADDQIPDTLIPVLQRLAREQLPVLEDTGRRLDQWVADHPTSSTVKRVIGKHSFQIEGEIGERCITPFSYWMFQRCLSAYNDTQDKTLLDTILKTIGARSAFQNQATTKLDYSDFRLRVAGESAEL